MPARPGRNWLPVDVNYSDDAAVAELSDLAQLTDLRAMLFSKRIQSDGELTERQLRRLVPESADDPDALVQELVDSSLWTCAEGTYWRRSWAQWNDSASEVEAKAARGGYYAHLRWHVQKSLFKPECSHCQAGVSMPTQRGTHMGTQWDTECKTSQINTSQINKTLSRDDSLSEDGETASPVTSLPARRRRDEKLEADFEIAWTQYPRKDAKQAALKAYVARRRAGAQSDELLRAVGNFKRAMQAEQRDRTKIMHGSRFFGPNEEWREYLSAQPPAASGGAAHPERTW